LQVLAIFDKPDPLEGPFFEETIYVTPSQLSDDQQSAIRECALRAVRVLGLTQGPVHAEFRINEQGVWPLEVAPRRLAGFAREHFVLFQRSPTEIIGLEELLLRNAVEIGGGTGFEKNPLRAC